MGNPNNPKGMNLMYNIQSPMIEGYAYVPRQIASDRNLYSPEMGLSRGTIFPTLDLPLGVYGKQSLGKEASDR